ncbi:hypothetical protein [Microcoleus sp. Pol10D4]|uniref:hypothetical protein n=1 Tax=Microcoleus sp. Pol10D4 TaxID=3055387 RepID=UPI002FD02472
MKNTKTKEGRRKKEEGRRKKEEGRRKKEEGIFFYLPLSPSPSPHLPRRYFYTGKGVML